MYHVLHCMFFYIYFFQCPRLDVIKRKTISFCYLCGANKAAERKASDGGGLGSNHHLSAGIYPPPPTPPNYCGIRPRQKLVLSAMSLWNSQGIYKALYRVRPIANCVWDQRSPPPPPSYPKAYFWLEMYGKYIYLRTSVGLREPALNVKFWTRVGCFDWISRISIRSLGI